MIAKGPMLHVLLGKPNPIALALAFYQANSPDVDFFNDLADYMQNDGIVVVRPTCVFLARMAWVTTEKHGKVHAWFVRFALGNLRELATLVPCHLDWVAFQRRGKDTVHVWPLTRMKDLIYREKMT